MQYASLVVLMFVAIAVILPAKISVIQLHPLMVVALIIGKIRSFILMKFEDNLET